MNADEGHEVLDREYTSVYGHFFEEDSVSAVELSRDKPIDELDADLLLDALSRSGYIEHVSSYGGEQYSLEEFDVETHQQVMEEFDL